MRMSRRPKFGVARYYTHARGESGTIVRLLFLRLLIPDRIHASRSDSGRLVG
jgi:hypothetical protein